MDFLDEANTWIDSHKALLTFVAIPFVTWLATRMVNNAAEKRAKSERKSERELQRQLKISDFRQEWINGLRDDLAQYSAINWSAETQQREGAKEESLVLQARILMRVNSEDPEYPDLQASLRRPVANLAEGRVALFVVGQRILKREWERLKADLNATEAQP